jgi:thiol-disulfide isomerase/thioredoxin
MIRNTLLALGLAGALGIGAAVAPVRAQEIPKAEQDEFRAASRTSDATARVAGLKKFIAAHPKSTLLPIARESLVSALIAANAPTAEILAETDRAVSVIPAESERAEMYNSVAMALADRGEQLDRANDFAQKAVAAVPKDDPDAAEMAAIVTDTLGWVQHKRGEHDKAATTFATALTYSPDNGEILYHYGLALEKAGRTDEAIDAYIRAVGVFPAPEKRADQPLRALYEKRAGSIEGLDAKIAMANEASRRRVVFEARKFEKQAPEWALKDIAGNPEKLADFKGKVVVMDFWGSWCPPCRAELPSFQALHVKYKENKNVVFLGMNWERPGEPAARMKAVTDFMANNKYTFPVVIDHDSVAVKAYGLQGFPTVYMIDPSGMIRFKNVGYEDGVERIIEAQLESMLQK